MNWKRGPKKAFKMKYEEKQKKKNRYKRIRGIGTVRRPKMYVSGLSETE